MPRWWVRAAATAVVLSNFLWFSWASLGSRFAPDEMMNMAWAWEAGGPKIVAQIFKIWEPFYRPTGALYYWSFYRLFHLDPTPFRIFDLGLLIFNLWLAYRLARWLRASRPVAWLAVLLFSYHEKVMIWAAYNGAWTYDRLCFTGTIGLLIVYIRMRFGDSGAKARWLIVPLFLLALGAKEMAVVVPALLIAFEASYWGAVPRPRRGEVVFLGTLCAMSLLYAYGRTHGQEALAAKAGYQLKPVTVGNYLASQGRHLQDYLFTNEPWRADRAALVLAILLAVALATRSRLLGFAFAFILIAPVPIAFVDRAGGALYIPLLGWCLFAAELCERAAALARAARVRQALFWAGGAGLFCWLTLHNVEHFSFEQPAALRNGDVTWRVISDLNRLRPAIRPGAVVYVQDNPFEGWDMWFILALWADVTPIDVRIVGKNAPEGAATPGVTAVITLDPAGHLLYRETARPH